MQSGIGYCQILVIGYCQILVIGYCQILVIGYCQILVIGYCQILVIGYCYCHGYGLITTRGETIIPSTRVLARLFSTDRVLGKSSSIRKRA